MDGPNPSPDPVKSMAGKIGAHTKWSRETDRSAATLAARNALEDKWLTEAGGDPVRAKHLKALHYSRMAMKSAKARRKPQPLQHEAGGPDARAS